MFEATWRPLRKGQFIDFMIQHHGHTMDQSEDMYNQMLQNDDDQNKVDEDRRIRILLRTGKGGLRWTQSHMAEERLN